MRDRLPMIFSTTALLVALLGATPLGKAALNAAVPRNSVGTKQLRKNASGHPSPGAGGPLAQRWPGRLSGRHDGLPKASAATE